MLADLRFDKDGLIPVVVQEESTREVLLVAWMNAQALEKTLATGLAHFWSRSRGKLWMKGETSGKVQEVVGLYVNCEENSLLLRVNQRGEAACHEGYHSCYYRRLNPAGAWEIIAPRLFDPAEVYGEASATVPTGGVASATLPTGGVASATLPTSGGIVPPASRRSGAGDGPAGTPGVQEAFQRIYRAYEYLRDHDLTAVSGTSRRLRPPDLAWLRGRASEELAELAGVLAGTHAHTSQREDAILEGRQVVYWLMVLACALGLAYEQFSPHQALLSGYAAVERLDTDTATAFAHQASQEGQAPLEIIASGLRLVGGACRELDIPLLTLAEQELEELGQKDYLRAVAVEE